MRELSDAKLEAFEDGAFDGLKQIKAFFAYQGTDSVYERKAKVGATIISAYARMRASETNRMAVELMMDRHLSHNDLPGAYQATKSLKAAK